MTSDQHLQEVIHLYLGRVKPWLQVAFERNLRGQEQIYNEIRNANAHLMWAYSETGVTAEERQRQVNRARSHLERAALDIRKIIWFDAWSQAQRRRLPTLTHRQLLDEAARVAAGPLCSGTDIAAWGRLLESLGVQNADREDWTLPETRIGSDDLGRIFERLRQAHNDEVRLILFACRRPKAVNPFHAQLIDALVVATSSPQPGREAPIQECLSAIERYHAQLCGLESSVLQATIEDVLARSRNLPRERVPQWGNWAASLQELGVQADRLVLDSAASEFERQRTYRDALRNLLGSIKSTWDDCPVTIPNAQEFHDPGESSPQRDGTEITPTSFHGVVWFLDLVGSSRNGGDKAPISEFHQSVYGATHRAQDMRSLAAVNTWGDGAMAAFTDIDAGLECLRVCLDRFRAQAPGWHLRGGVAKGPIARVPNPVVGADVTGDAVIIAARLEPVVPEAYELAVHGIEPAVLARAGFSGAAAIHVRSKKNVTTGTLTRTTADDWEVLAWTAPRQ